MVVRVFKSYSWLTAVCLVVLSAETLSASDFLVEWSATRKSYGKIPSAQVNEDQSSFIRNMARLDIEKYSKTEKESISRDVQLIQESILTEQQYLESLRESLAYGMLSQLGLGMFSVNTEFFWDRMSTSRDRMGVLQEQKRMMEVKLKNLQKNGTVSISLIHQ